MKPFIRRGTRWGGRALALALGATLGCSGSVDGMSSPRSPTGNDDDGMTPGPKPMGKGGSPGTGMTGSGGQPGVVDPPGTGGSPVTMPPPVQVVPGITPLRRLTSEEYRNTVRDLLLMADAKTLVPEGALPPDGSILEKFTTNVGGALAGEDAGKYASAAESLADKAITTLATLVSCDPKTGDVCAQTFIKGFGRRAFRRPLTDIEASRYQKVFTAGGDFTTGVKLVVQAMLQSPNFLYLVEPVGADGWGKVVSVDSYAMASRLSYFLAKSMPDDALFAAAEANQLATPEQVAAQATRLMAKPGFRDTISFFHKEWLELDGIESADKDPALFPAWTDGVKLALEEQSSRFVQSIVAAPAGTIESLLTSTAGFMSGAEKGALYDLYGVAKPATLPAANAWVQVQLDPTQRGGILTQASIMATQAHENRTSFIYRGKLVVEGFLCTTLAPPPAGVDTNETGIDPKLTARERSVQHRKNPSCATCHASFDPIGFAFERYDPSGKYRPAVDATADIDQTGTALDGQHVADAIELTKKLSTSPDVRGCLARQWMRFALARDFDPDDTTSSDAAALKKVQQAVNDSGGKFSDLFTAVVRSDAFRTLKVNQ
jgi:hypothetical protein